MAGAYPTSNTPRPRCPRGYAGSVTVLGGEDIAMFNTANKEGRLGRFMEFMTSRFAQEEMAKVGQIPVNTTALGRRRSERGVRAPSRGHHHCEGPPRP